jgi:hypothetical protein
MCYSAQIKEEYKKLARAFGAGLSLACPERASLHVLPRSALMAIASA